MLYRRIIGQLISVHIKHAIGGPMLKTLFSGCVHRCPLSSASPSMPTEMKQLTSCSRILWDYLRIDSPLQTSDLILVLGNSDLRTADHAASLFKDGYAPLVAVSGRVGHGTKGKWNKPEAVVFAERLVKKEVPYDRIIMEPQATNTGENIRFTQKLLQRHPDFIQPASIILVQTPFMGRRSLATFLKQWDQADKVEVLVTSPPISLEQYPDIAAGYGSLKDVAMEMVRTMQRIEEYPRLGFQVPQYIPSEVREAYQSLQRMLIKSETGI